MATITIDQALIASRTQGDTRNSLFVKTIMHSITPYKTPQSFFARLQHLPKMALVAIAIAVLALASGTAYAAYQLWFNPSAKVQHFGQNQYGRDEALVTFQNCKKTAGNRYEVKSGNSISADEIAKLLQARCEMDAIATWADKLWPYTSHAHTSAYPNAFTVTSIDSDTVRLQGNIDSPTFALTKEIQFIVHGTPVDRSAVKAGDVVTIVEFLTYDSDFGAPISRSLKAIIALELPAQYYDNTNQNRVAERKGCIGNPAESCVESGSIDVYPRNGENNAAPTTPGDFYEIQGRIVSYDGDQVELKASSGAIYTIAAPLDIVAKFNTENSKDYENIKIGTGDMLSVRYMQKANDDHKNVQPQQLQSVVLLIELVQKTDPLKKY